MSGSGCLDVAHRRPAPVGMTNGWARDSGGSQVMGLGRRSSGTDPRLGGQALRFAALRSG